MTAVGLVHLQDERDELNYGPRSPPLTSIGSKSRKRPRTSSSSSTLPSTPCILPPYPPSSKNNNNSDSDSDSSDNNDNDKRSATADELGLTRPLRPRTSGASHTQRLPYIHTGEKESPFRKAMAASRRSGRKNAEDRQAWADDDFISEEAGRAGGLDGTQLSKTAKLMEEDRKKVASIRSFLLNFLEERDCSIKKRLVRFSRLPGIQVRGTWYIIVACFASVFLISV